MNDFEQRNKITVETFGRFVREKREQMGLSVRALAKLVGTSAVYLNDIEHSNRPAPRNPNVLSRLVNELHLDLDEQQRFNKLSLASRTEDIDDYLKDNPRVCVALRMAQELPDESVKKEWEIFIKRLKKLNLEQISSDEN